MFSPPQSNPAPSTRRTRRRPLSNGSIAQQPKAKRQRLTDETFVPPDAPEMEEVKAHRISGSRNEIFAPAPQREVPVRAKKTRTGDRGNKGDDSKILTTNDTYTVSKLPALPERLAEDTTIRQHGAIYSDNGYGLSLTHTHAIVWPYAVNIEKPETFTFTLPQTSKRLDGPLPLGSLVSASASSSDPGLVVVMPTSGKIIFWESISSAATMGLRLQRTGVEFSITNMSSGESAIQILNAESAGFVLTFSTGRTAYMSVRDGQGRPSISVQFFRESSGTANSGRWRFGSVRNLISSSSWQDNIAAVRAGRPDKVGERNVVIAGTKGSLQSWDIYRGGHTSLIAESEGREKIVMAIKHTVPELSSLLIESFEIHDFTYTSKQPLEPHISDQKADGIQLLLLVSLTERQDSRYFLVGLVLRPNNLDIRSIRPIKSYSTPISRTASSKPRLYLPDPALFAFVVFDRAVIVISTAKQPRSPGFQLEAESRGRLVTFEDVIDFRKDMNVEIVGSGIEEFQDPSHIIEDTKSRRHKAKHPAIVLLVRGGGVLRVSTISTVKPNSKALQQVTAKSKLEQAVFFGTLEHNPLSFVVRPEAQFSAEEVSNAALELSDSILRSEITHIANVPANMELNFRKRSAALHELARYLKDSGMVFDRATKWKLLWGAERMAAAALVWKRYDTHMQRKPEGQKRGIVTEVVESIHEQYKTEPIAEDGELDRVRHWFTKDVWNLEFALPWAFQAIKVAVQDGQKDNKTILGLLSEANDLTLVAMQAAFDFREANLSLYNLGAEELKHAILKSGYEGLPEFWTSTMFVTENLRKQADFAGALIQRALEDPSIQGSPASAIVEKLRIEQPALIDMAIRASNERMRWDMAQNDPVQRAEAESIQALQSSSQDKQIILLATHFELADEAIDLAEKHEFLPTLAYVLQFELIQSSNKVPNSSSESAREQKTRKKNIENRIRECFNRFGQSWATALYEFEIEQGSISDLLERWPEQQKYLTSFLRGSSKYSQICWINDVVKEEDFDHASMALLDLGLNREEHVWSKKIEVSFGKLALLAGRNYSRAGEAKTELASANKQLALIKIQDHIYDLVLPFISNAIDENAELQIALETLGNNALTRQQALLMFMEESMGKLIKQETMTAGQLIDLLTLMKSSELTELPVDQEASQGTFRSQMFYFALQATCYGSPKEDQELTQRIIWRRCMLRDNWADVNNTEMKHDQQVSDQLRRTALYMTFRTCFANRLFDKDSSVKPISPSNVMGASTQELEQRFSILDSQFQDKIRRDMRVEDDALRPAIEQFRLEHWFQAALELAKDDFRGELSNEMKDGPAMNLAEAKLEEAEKNIRDKLAKEQRKAQDLLRTRPKYKAKAKVNGHVGNFRSSIMKY